MAAPADVEVRPGSSSALDAVRLPSMAGRLRREGDDLCFLPRFAFVAGTAYTVSVGGDRVAVLTRPRPQRPATTEVVDVWPSGRVVPRNLLRVAIQFSAPMSDGSAARLVRLLDERGDEIVGAWLPAEPELWDADRRTLTMLLDPARIKRGLAPHREAGYPLVAGTTVRLVVDGAFPDATGTPLRKGAERRYEVGADERRHVDPAAWALRVPPAGTADALEVVLDRPLDHTLLRRSLHVVGPDDQVVGGLVEIRDGERSWRLTPDRAWRTGRHGLLVDPALEDLAGNSVWRVFDRDLSRPDDEPRDAATVVLGFEPP